MDKARKQQLRDEWRGKQRASARDRFPLPPSELRELFKSLDGTLPLHGCDHTRRLTKVWAETNKHDVARLYTWLDETGGFCDCEVLFNSKQSFEESMRDVP